MVSGNHINNAKHDGDGEKSKVSKFIKSLSLKPLLITVAVIVFIMLIPGIGSQGALTVAMDDSRIGIAYSGGGAMEIPFTDIESAEMIAFSEPGQVISENGDESTWVGSYENSEFGVYQLYRNISVDSCIAVYTSKGIVVFNLGTLKKTEKFFENLNEHLGAL